MKYQIKIEGEAKFDIQEAITWYNTQQAGLGKKFHAEIKEYLNSLKISPFFEIKYDKIRCLPLKKFPYILHYTIDEINNFVIIRAVYHTGRNPELWNKPTE